MLLVEAQADEGLRARGPLVGVAGASRDTMSPQVLEMFVPGQAWTRWPENGHF
jgi:hypothetical protein